MVKKYESTSTFSEERVYYRCLFCVVEMCSIDKKGDGGMNQFDITKLSKNIDSSVFAERCFWMERCVRKPFLDRSHK